MSKILHTSDLHFSGRTDKEWEYSRFVWKEILDLSIREKVDAILLAGDVFDRYGDLEAHRKDFTSLITKDAPPIYAITGNHEYLEKKSNDSFSSFGMDPVNWFHEPGFRIVNPGKGWELAVVPYSTRWENYREWDIPEKKCPRILMAHGMLPEAMIYTGPSEEEGDHLLELDLIRKFNPDYTALGHIHKRTHIKIDSLEIHYSGAPRIWRRSEKGIRSVNVLEISENKPIHVTTVPLESVGQNREIKIQIPPHGNIPLADLESLQKNQYSSMDCVSVYCEGFVDSESEFNYMLEEIRIKWQSKFRKLDFIIDNVYFMDGISTLPLVKNFLAHWEQKFNTVNSEDEKLIWQEARQIGLEAISQKYKNK